MTAPHAPTPLKSYVGYYRKQSAEPDRFLCETGRGTPGGEYLRRFWHPVAYESELQEVPLRVRALGEDLVCFRDLSGRIGVLHLHCSHRNSSLLGRHGASRRSTRARSAAMCCWWVR